MTISRRAFGFSAAALAIVAAAPASAQSNLSAADQATLRQAQAYLTGLTAAQGNFIETGPGGQQRTGKFWLQRPGKMRLNIPSRRACWSWPTATTSSATTRA